MTLKDYELWNREREIEKLQADNEQLRAALSASEARNNIFETGRSLEADNERLRAENQTAWNKADELDERARHAEAEIERLTALVAQYAKWLADALEVTTTEGE